MHCTVTPDCVARLLLYELRHDLQALVDAKIERLDWEGAPRKY